ncbi:MAG: hypothetical protein ACTHKU_08210 [Verrucomicrobiota bacterium]
MNKIASAALLLAWACAGTAQTVAPSARSFSGQFVAYASTAPLPSRFYKGTTDALPLDPAVLVISCERIKQSLNRELDIKTPGTGTVFLHLRPGRIREETATIVVQKSINEWNYHLDIPDSLERVTFIRTIVEALLLGQANGDAQSQVAELPLWLSEGLSQEVVESERKELLLPRPTLKGTGFDLNRLVIDGRRRNPMEQAKKILQERSPLTFEQLSWTTADQLSGDSLETFRSSAQLFVHDLLQLKNGPASMQAMLRDLPRHQNWQFALLTAFHSQFANLLDVEKWWALRTVQFTGRDLTQAWTPEESWKKLDEVLQSQVDIRMTAHELPQRQVITVQAMIRDWDARRQPPALQRKLRELSLLQPRVAQTFVPLVDEYRQAIGNYLDKQKFSGSWLGLVKPTGPLRNRVSEEAIRDLNALDLKRQALRPMTPLPLAAQ